MNSVLVGLFDTQGAAEEARTRLVAAGFSGNAVSVSGSGSSAPAKTVSDGAGAAPVHEGGIGHFFRSLFGDDDTAARGHENDTYEEAFRRGSYAVSVKATSESELDHAENVLNECGAIDIDEKAVQWKTEGWTGGAVAATAASAVGTLKEGATRTLQEVEEELKVGKRAVQRGGVRIFSRLTEVPVEETVRLREEHAEVQRRVVDRPATEADFAAFKEGTIELREMSEEAVVSKSARVVGEVEVGTRVSEREETVRDTVRRTEIDVEPISGSMPGASGRASGDVHATTGLTGTATQTDAGSANRDPLSGEPGSHPVGTAVGASAGGVAAGAAIGTVAGPVGTVIGAAVGAVAGGLAGKGVAEKIDPTDVPRT